jgi:phage-related protein/DNA-binding transcriptional regulator YiaG
MPKIEALPKDMRARLVRLTQLIQLFGFRGLPPDSVRHLDGKLWELRITGRDGISRAIYVTAAGRRVVIVRVFVKKTQARIGPRLRTSQGGEMTRIDVLHKKWLKDREYRKAYETLEEEFALAAAIMKARNRAGLSQAELAQRMKTTQSTVARLESGRGRPSTRTLDRFANATGHRLKITFEPVANRRLRAGR